MIVKTGVLILLLLQTSLMKCNRSLRDGRTDLRVPVGHIDDYDLIDMINIT